VFLVGSMFEASRQELMDRCCGKAIYMLDGVRMAPHSGAGYLCLIHIHALELWVAIGKLLQGDDWQASTSGQPAAELTTYQTGT